MDELWGNAWGEPPKPEQEELPAATATWSPSHSRTLSSLSSGQEADIGLPSWSTTTDIAWTEPSEVQSPLWSQTEHDAVWSSTPYDSIPLGKANLSQETIAAAPPIPTPEAKETNTVSERPQSPIRPESSRGSPPAKTEDLPPPPITPESTSVRPDSPDGFGSFDGDVGKAVDPWTPAVDTFDLDKNASADVDASNWGSTWAEKVKEREPKDEWEAAKQERERRERRVPPELVNDILEKCQNLTKQLWPEEEKSSSSNGQGQGRQDLGGWRGGMEAVVGLDQLMKSVLPEVSAPPILFGKTNVAKSMASTVKLTKNLPLAQTSPMSQFMAARGSMAWESAIRSQIVIAQDDTDVLPSGWKILDKDKDTSPSPPADANKGKKASTGFLSFWSRRTSTQPSTPDLDGKSSSPTTSVHVSRTSSPAFSSHSPRPSLDSTKSPALSTGVATPPIRSPTMPTMPAVPEASLPISSQGSTTSLEATIANLGTLHPPMSSSPPPAPPPSAVSRFLNRFSKSKSGSRPNSPKDSIALSSEDIDFLSDMVPSANDDEEDDYGHGPQLNGLTQLLTPQQEKLPPPLSPPPKFTPPAARPVSLVESSMGSGSDFSAAFSSSAFSITAPTSVPPVPSVSSSIPPTLASGRPLSMSSVPTQSSSPIPTLTPHPASTAVSPRTSIGSPINSIFPPPSTKRNSSQTPSISSASSRSRTPDIAIPVARMNQAAIGSRPSSILQPILPPPPPPASSTRSQTPGTVPPPIPPPPSAPMSRPQSAAPANLFDDDDEEFSDFHISSPAPSFSQPRPISEVTSRRYSAATPQKPPVQTSGHRPSTSSFDEFDRFLTSPIRSPSPPPLPAKSPSLAKKRLSSSPSKAAQAANHLATLNLMNKAAARPGRWPAPPSPLPEALPPPPGKDVPPRNSFDLLGGDLPEKPSQGRSTNGPSKPPTSLFGPLPSMSFTQPAPKPMPSAPSQSLMDFSSFDSFSPPQSIKTTPAPLVRPPSTTQGGLSAQDLSFFEGL